MAGKNIRLFISGATPNAEALGVSDVPLSYSFIPTRDSGGNIVATKDDNKVLLHSRFVSSSVDIAMTVTDSAGGSTDIVIPQVQLVDGSSIIRIPSDLIQAIDTGIVSVDTISGSFYTALEIGEATDILVSSSSAHTEYQTIESDRVGSCAIRRDHTGNDISVDITGINTGGVAILSENLDRVIGFQYIKDDNRVLVGNVVVPSQARSGQIDALAEFSLSFAGSGSFTYIVV